MVGKKGVNDSIASITSTVGDYLHPKTTMQLGQHLIKLIPRLRRDKSPMPAISMKQTNHLRCKSFQ
jgi:hypothetical protein